MVWRGVFFTVMLLGMLGCKGRGNPRLLVRHMHEVQVKQVQFTAPREVLEREVRRWASLRGVSLATEDGALVTPWMGDAPFQRRNVFEIVPGTKGRHRLMMFAVTSNDNEDHLSRRVVAWEWELVLRLEPEQAARIEEVAPSP